MERAALQYRRADDNQHGGDQASRAQGAFLEQSVTPRQAPAYIDAHEPATKTLSEPLQRSMSPHVKAIPLICRSSGTGGFVGNRQPICFRELCKSGNNSLDLVSPLDFVSDIGHLPGNIEELVASLASTEPLREAVADEESKPCKILSLGDLGRVPKKCSGNVLAEIASGVDIEAVPHKPTKQASFNARPQGCELGSVEV